MGLVYQRRIWTIGVGVLVTAAAVLGVGSRLLAEDAPAYKNVRIEGVPHVKQKPDFCGEAAAEMYLRKLGRNMDQDDVFDQSGLDPALGRGVYTAELATALTRIGFEVGETWTPVLKETDIETAFAALHRDLVRGIPSIVCMRYSDSPHTTEHFRLVLGYDRQRDTVLYHEPAEKNGAYRRMKREKFLELWPIGSGPSRTLVRLRLEAKDLISSEASDENTPADYAQHVQKLLEKVPEGFRVVVEPPFVVIGNETEARVRRRAETAVRWTIELLKKDFFEKDPQEIIDIWLFKDDATYRYYAYKIFGHHTSTPYGYYSQEEQALIMNVNTGEGTLVHEIVHPYTRANFPKCPPWFFEGLGSLFEACGDLDGHIVGTINWRLRGLKEAIVLKLLPSFKTLAAFSSDQFYGEDSGMNYAQARYLLYYLQEKGLLVNYYHAFRKSHKTDPTGYKTLKKILGEKDMTAFQQRWEKWVMELPGY